MDEDQKIRESLKKLEAAYEQFVLEVDIAQKEYREKISEIVRRIEARKIEKLRGEIKSS